MATALRAHVNNNSALVSIPGFLDAGSYDPDEDINRFLNVSSIQISRVKLAILMYLRDLGLDGHLLIAAFNPPGAYDSPFSHSQTASSREKDQKKRAARQYWLNLYLQLMAYHALLQETLSKLVILDHAIQDMILHSDDPREQHQLTQQLQEVRQHQAELTENPPPSFSLLQKVSTATNRIYDAVQPPLEATARHAWNGGKFVLTKAGGAAQKATSHVAGRLSKMASDLWDYVIP